jgi:hypothetical protein
MYSASYLTENETQQNESHIEDTIPDERDWKRDVIALRKRAGDFNINNYVEKVLTEDELKEYNHIRASIPVNAIVYMQYSLRKQFKQIKESYEKWLEQSAKTDQEVELPEIMIKVPRDEAETSVVHDEW